MYSELTLDELILILPLETVVLEVSNLLSYYFRTY